MIEALAWGIGTEVVGRGHPGRARYGQSRGGAVDIESLALGNRLLGNAVDAAGVETCGGLVLRTTTPAMVCVTGAVAVVQVEHGPPVGWGAPVVLPAGATMRVVRVVDGARTYVCVRGGCVRDGDRLTVGPDPGTPATSHPAVPRALGQTARLWPGPRLDWFVSGTWERLLSGAWTVASSSRVGVRMSGPVLQRSVAGELPSEGLVEGAVQVPPDGQPIVMLADHPTTGGYPVVAVVDPADLAVLAQSPPGAHVRFHPAHP